MGDYLCEKESTQQSEPIHPMLLPVQRVLRQRDDAVKLCAEILDTLSLPANQDYVIGGDAVRQIMLRWKKKFSECSGDK